MPKAKPKPRSVAKAETALASLDLGPDLNLSTPEGCVQAIEAIVAAVADGSVEAKVGQVVIQGAKAAAAIVRDAEREARQARMLESHGRPVGNAALLALAGSRVDLAGDE